jgi:thiol-disulfide isomerase/thioredoxin
LKRLLVLLISLAAAAAQTPEKPSPQEEDRLLQQAVSEAGNSPVEFIRVVERYLRQHPKAARRKDLERAVLRAAIDAHDYGRVISYGEKILESDDDRTLLEGVARAWLVSDEAASARRSLKYSERLEKSVEKARSGAAAQQEDLDRTLARALVFQARAWGNMGDLEKAVALARKSYDAYPTAEGAREAARWEARLGRSEVAIEYYAEAFSIPDAKASDEDRRKDRVAAGELYKKVHGSEAGLGDALLAAYDRTAAAVRASADRSRKSGANSALLDAFAFRLRGLRGDEIRLADFKDKILVLDFWATWCVPCRFLHPLVEQVKHKYAGHPEIVFLSINADEDRSLVRPFIDELKWSDQVYFDDGLAFFYRISSIPTTLVFNRRKEMVARMAGFAPTAYVDMLTEGIEEARKE